MKIIPLKTLAALATLATASGTHAAVTTLISDSLRNGGFETGTGVYNTGTNWFNYGAGSEDATAVYSATHLVGAQGGIVSFASQPAVNSGWTIGLHDSYELSFQFKNSNTTAGTIRTHLYYYSSEGDIGFDERSATTRVDLVTTDVALLTNSTTWSLGSSSLPDMTNAASVGKTLYLGFERTAPGSFPVIDSVTLTAVPEPSTYGLMGAGLFVAFMRHRRSKA